MATIHFTIAPKGGIGKSTASIFGVQALQQAGRKVAIIDLDPETNTLKPFTDLEVIQPPNMKDQFDEIDASAFDWLIEVAEARTELTDIYIDSGSSNYVSLVAYLLRNDTFELFRDCGHSVMIHTILKGGAEQSDCIKGIEDLIARFPNEKLIIWLNEYEHELTIENKKVSELTETQFYKAIANHVLCMFRLPLLHRQTEMPVLKKLNENGVLLTHVKQSDLFSLPEKQRVKKFNEVIISQVVKLLPKVANQFAKEQGLKDTKKATADVEA